MNNHLSRTLIHVTRVTFRSGGSIQIKVMLRLTRITDTMNTDKLDIMNNATLWDLHQGGIIGSRVVVS